MKTIYKIWLFDDSTLKHLRFSFSFFLLPVFIFALSQAEIIYWPQTFLSFFILHFLVFPSSNGYNSYQDRDETSIGGLKHPPKVNRNLFYATLVFDLLALLLGMLISLSFSLLILVFIIMSRAYSYRGIRLKKFPVIGYLTVFIFQGAFVYLISLVGITGQSPWEALSWNHFMCMGVASLFIGSMYPLTQIYQHESDKKDGVISISYLLGYNGTFIFSGILFTLGTLLMMVYFWFNNNLFAIGLFLIFMLPMVIRMSSWFSKVSKDIRHANFDNTMTMNKVSSSSMNLYFFILALNNNLDWI